VRFSGVAQTQRLITSAQVADLLGWHIRKVQRYAEAGDLPIIQRMPGGRYLYDAAEVELWLYRQAEKASA